jgi:hypothetical protein
MSFDPSTLEADLRRLNAAPLDDSLLARLDACTEDSWSRLSPAETAAEHRLRAETPAALPASLMASLEEVVRNVPYPGDDKIVSFPSVAPARRRQGKPWWATAAAVALTGVLTAFLVPVKPVETASNTSNRDRSRIAASPAAGELVPAGFNSGLSEAVDQGVVWQADQQPHRVLKVVYKDVVTLKDTNGGTYQLERPRVEYFLVPANTN